MTGYIVQFRFAGEIRREAYRTRALMRDRVAQLKNILAFHSKRYGTVPNGATIKVIRVQLGERDRVEHVYTLARLEWFASFPTYLAQRASSDDYRKIRD